MFEIMKKVNGFEIKRKAGTMGEFRVDFRDGRNGFSVFLTFRTMKEAKRFCETAPEYCER
jgi:hypothetical protein